MNKKEWDGWERIAAGIYRHYYLGEIRRENGWWWLYCKIMQGLEYGPYRKLSEAKARARKV